MWFQVFLSNTNNLHIAMWFQVFISNAKNYIISRSYLHLIVIICLLSYMVSNIKVTVISIVVGRLGMDPKGFGKDWRNWKSKNQDHPDHSIVKIG